MGLEGLEGAGLERVGLEGAGVGAGPGAGPGVGAGPVPVVPVEQAGVV